MRTNLLAHMRTRFPCIALLALVTLCPLLTACVQTSGLKADAVTATAPGVTATVDPSWPASVEHYRTTGEDIYLANLEARISEFDRVLGATPSPSLRTELASALYHRFKIIGNVADAERAASLLDASVREEPTGATHRLLRATLHSSFHRFSDAESDLAVARKSGDTKEVMQAAREIDLALGRYDRLKGEFMQSTQPSGDFYESVHRADLRLMEGDLAGANYQFRAAQVEYRDVNPVPIAWLHVQRGIGALRFGDIEDAHRFFEAAHARMPQYYLATEHLAETETARGNYERARTLYAQVIEQTHNPEFLAARAGLERSAGQKSAAREWNRKAEAAYAESYARHPDAYAQHYADYLLEADEPRRALELAERNILLRQDVGSWILLARAAEASGRRERACDAYAGALATGRYPPELAEIAALGVRCAGKAPA